LIRIAIVEDDDEENEEEAERLKILGNNSMQKGEKEEAIEFYTQSIDTCKTIAACNNRSFAFLQGLLPPRFFRAI
jgi:hypothetical protein